MVKRVKRPLGRKTTLREQIVRDARALFAQKFINIVPEHAACLYWTLATILSAQVLGKRLVPQAGTASWMFVPPSLDDGVSPNQFTYKWEPDSHETRRRIIEDLLPEMHVWCADPQERMVIDLAIKYQPQQCLRMIGAEWLTADPPDYLWAREGRVRRGYYYQPDPIATALACQNMARVIRHYDLG